MYHGFTPLLPKKTVILKYDSFYTYCTTLFLCHDCGEFNMTDESLFVGSAGLLPGLYSSPCNCITLYSCDFREFLHHDFP
jgi:hypothetical protein